MKKLWKIPTSLAALFAANVVFADASKNQLECWNFIDADKHIVLILPIKEHRSVVTMTMNGMDLPALYVVDGMEQRWAIDPDSQESDYQVVVGVNLMAAFYDFSGLKSGEEASAEAMFQCRVGGGR